MSTQAGFKLTEIKRVGHHVWCHVQFYVMLGIKPRVSHRLGRYSIIRATAQPLSIPATRRVFRNPSVRPKSVVISAALPQLYSRRREGAFMSDAISCWKESSQNQRKSAEQTFSHETSGASMKAARAPGTSFLDWAEMLSVHKVSLKQRKPKVTLMCPPLGRLRLSKANSGTNVQCH